ncbi:Uncharacterized protein TPAR_00953 [Tolypocladium paradoxum]|uniref:DUF7730 domain-containing protein n=1 Tax=Tolypocladium paradoxum TaxID=94208 RepID=A0A2S4L8S2_9HYPO|nr:Uncharacterized protein TPAR_00953 [Tolypocladium paradoxum]
MAEEEEASNRQSSTPPTNGEDDDSGTKTDHPSPRLKHDEDSPSDGDSHTLRDSSSAAKGTDDNQESESECSTMAPSSESPSSSGEEVDLVATFRKLLGVSDSDSDGEDGPEDDTRASEIPLEHEGETESEHNDESTEAPVEDDDELELEHCANSPEARVTAEDEVQPEHDDKSPEPETSTSLQNPGGDAQDALSDPISPPPERQSKRRRDDDDGDDPDDKRREKRSKRKKRAGRLDKLILKEARKSKQRRERKHRRRRGLAVINEAGLPTPTEDAFPSHISSRDDDHADWEPPVKNEAGMSQFITSPPRIPDVMDDSPDPVDETTTTKKKTKKELHKEKRNAKKKGGRKAKEGGERQRRVVEPTPEPEPEPDPEPSALHRLPPEIRLKIYAELLRADKPILVYGGWRLVYRRQHKRKSERRHDRQKKEDEALDTPIAILSTCRLFYQEALPVLYGENTFLYRLRDPIATVTDVARLVQIDTSEEELLDAEYEDEGGAESGSDWEEGHATRRGASRRRAKKTAFDIDIGKHLHLFRRIVVEAEHNRFSEDTKHSMACAIDAFATRHPGRHPAPNIRSLTVRVAPLWDHAGGTVGRFTFVDFFAAESPVMQAMRAVRCCFLRVDLMTRYMDGPSEKAGCSLTVDRRHEMLHLRSSLEPRAEYWPRDVVARCVRKAEATKACSALNSMGEYVDKFCRAYVQGVAGGLAAMEHLWDEFEDIGEGF